MSSWLLRTAIALVFVMPACVVELNDKNSPLPNGGVTGPAADCSKVTPLGRGGPGTGAPGIKFLGRFDLSDPARPQFDWSGNEISARFDGTEVTVGLVAPVPMVFEAIVDDRPPFKFKVVPGQTGYQVATGLPAGTHEVTIHRNSEALYGGITFTGFAFGAGGKVLAPTDRPRRIEYIGDSIMCGYGDEGQNATCPFDIPEDPANPDADRVPVTENQYLAYGSLAARALSADAVTLCYSGKGVYQNYREKGFGEGPNTAHETPDPDAKTTIPMYYERALASRPDSPAWDFTKEPEPQAVVISIGTNDFARDLNLDSIADGIDLGKFRDAYTVFVKRVRVVRPNAHIFLALPPMVTDKFPLDNARSDFRDALNAIVSTLNAAGDAKVYFIELVEMGMRYGLGCDYHPNLEVHRIMADQVAGAIRTKTCW